jgi:hypothetical protein
MQGYFSAAHRISDTFFNTPLLNMEREWYMSHIMFM